MGQPPEPTDPPTRVALDLTPRELVARIGSPDTIAGWKALAQGLLTDQGCVFRRNLEVSSLYAWLYRSAPHSLKWAGMAAFASYHVRLALYPFRLDTDRTGYADIQRSLGRRRVLLLADVDVIRATNNGIFDDIFWVHLAYASTDDGLDRLDELLGSEPSYAPVLAAFGRIDRACRMLEDDLVSEARRREAEDLVWQGNVDILEHEQRSLVQPHFDQLSCTYARLFSLGSALSFEAHGLRELPYFSSFYLYSFGRGISQVLRAGAWPRVTRFEDRWRWIVAAVVPRFQVLDSDGGSVAAKLDRIEVEARQFGATTCVVPG